MAVHFGMKRDTFFKASNRETETVCEKCLFDSLTTKIKDRNQWMNVMMIYEQLKVASAVSWTNLKISKLSDQHHAFLTSGAKIWMSFTELVANKLVQHAENWIRGQAKTPYSTLTCLVYCLFMPRWLLRWLHSSSIANWTWGQAWRFAHDCLLT